jgi:hypothetical protein
VDGPFQCEGAKAGWGPGSRAVCPAFGVTDTGKAGLLLPRITGTPSPLNRRAPPQPPHRRKNLRPRPSSGIRRNTIFFVRGYEPWQNHPKSQMRWSVQIKISFRSIFIFLGGVECYVSKGMANCIKTLGAYYGRPTCFEKVFPSSRPWSVRTVAPPKLTLGTDLKTKLSQ